jgi:hypothetical protein
MCANGLGRGLAGGLADRAVIAIFMVTTIVASHRFGASASGEIANGK